MEHTVSQHPHTHTSIYCKIYSFYWYIYLYIYINILICDTLTRHFIELTACKNTLRAVKFFFLLLWENVLNQATAASIFINWLLRLIILQAGGRRQEAAAACCRLQAVLAAGSEVWSTFLRLPKWNELHPGAGAGLEHGARLRQLQALHS